MTFEQLGLIDPIQKALREVGYSTATSIQEQAIPIILQGRDIIGCAQTGTGKTAAFALPILQSLHPLLHDNNRKPQVLVLAPTRELAVQIGQNIEQYAKYTKLRHVVIFGGVSQVKQVEQLKRGVDIIIATPGRLLDLLNQRLATLSNVKFLVLDEADNMLDMGFIHDIKNILKQIPTSRQTLFFSATMPAAIRKFANTILKKPAEVSVDPVSSAAPSVKQSVYFIDKKKKTELLVKVLREKAMGQSLVFTRTKHGADRLVKNLVKQGISAAAIHGNKSQNARQKALADFQNGRVKILIATDIASRGIDIADLPHVINFDMPADSETYVHRIGRTGRAGKEGTALSFCCDEERTNLQNIQKLIGFQLAIA